MSLVIAAQSLDGLILAGDSRGTTGDPRGLTAVNDTYKKIHGLSKYCGIGIAGASELGDALLDGVADAIEEQEIEYIDNVLQFTRNQFRAKFQDWFTNIPLQDRPAVLFILCGYRSQQNSEDLEPIVFSLQSQLDFAPLLHSAGRAMIGVPQYAVYLWNRYYDPQMSKSDAAALTEFLIYETATQDPKVGGPIRVAEITPEQGYRELSEKQVQSVRKANESQSLKLQDFFFKGR